MTELGITSCAAITVICYLIGIAAKASPLNDKFIPVICGFCGGLLGILGAFIMPDFPANDLLTASAVGVISGLAATGANQIFKQFKKDDG